MGGKAVWDKTNLAGKKVASGVYIVLLSSDVEFNMHLKDLLQFRISSSMNHSSFSNLIFIKIENICIHGCLV